MTKLHWVTGLLLVSLSFVSVSEGRMERPPAAVEENDYQQAILSALAGLVDAQVLQVNRVVAALAQSSDVQSGDWEKMQQLVSAAAKADVPQILWFVRPDGTYYSSAEGLVADQTLSDRVYFPKLMSGERVLGELVVSKSTGKKSIIVAAPVFREGNVVGGLGASIFVDDLSRFLNKTLTLPRGSIFYGFAQNGLTCFHTDPALDFIDPRQLESESLRQAAQYMMDHRSGAASYEFRGAVRHVIFTTAPGTGWRIVFGRIESTPETIGNRGGVERVAP